jgi:hypothetical protein
MGGVCSKLTVGTPKHTEFWCGNHYCLKYIGDDERIILKQIFKEEMSDSSGSGQRQLPCCGEYKN